LKHERLRASCPQPLINQRRAGLILYRGRLGDRGEGGLAEFLHLDVSDEGPCQSAARHVLDANRSRRDILLPTFLRPSQALDHVLGSAAANDVSARDWQIARGSSQWTRGKSFDTFNARHSTS